MQNGSVLQDCKTAAAARSPLVLPEKRMYNQGQWDRARKPRDAPRESLSASVKEAKEEHCHGNFARDQPGAGGSGVLRLPGQRPYPGPAGGALTGPGRPEGGALPSGQRRTCGSCCRTWTRRFPSRQRPCSVCSATSRAFPTAPSGPIVRLFCSSLSHAVPPAGF